MKYEILFEYPQWYALNSTLDFSNQDHTTRTDHEPISSDNRSAILPFKLLDFLLHLTNDDISIQSVQHMYLMIVVIK